METSRRYFSRPRLFNCVCLCLVLSLTAHGQQASAPRPSIPPELQASDQEISTLLTSADSKAQAGDYDSAFADSKAALELAEKKGLLGDRAIVEKSVAEGSFVRGKVDEAFTFYQASLQHAVDASNLVLQADVLTSLSALPQFQGNLPGALDLLAKAQDRANKSKNLYIRARVLGELGKLQLLSGKIEQGRKSVEEALNIDRVNNYGFEPLHSVYSAYATLAQPGLDFVKAIAQLESARDLAVERNNHIALVLAQNVLGGIYIRTGGVQKGIATLEATLNGNVLKDGQTVQMAKAFREAANLPFMKTTILEGLAQGYEAAHDADKALKVWNDLYLLSLESNFTLALAEAASKMASIYNSKKDVPDALHYYEVAIQAWRLLRNNPQLSLNLTSQALLLLQSGRGEEAVPLETEVAEIAQKTQDRKALVTAYGVLGEIYQPLNKFQEARAVLEKATNLISPGPGDTEIDPNVVIEHYTLLADDYKALRLPIKELIAIEKVTCSR